MTDNTKLRTDEEVGFNGQKPIQPSSNRLRTDEEVGFPPQPRGFTGALKDTAIDLAKGVIGFPEAGAGVLDMFTSGAFGRAAENLIDYSPKRAKDFLNDFYSPERKQANEEVQKARGFVPTIGAMVSNPSTIVGSALESAPSAVMGIGAVARGAVPLLVRAGMSASAAPIVAGAIGEGVLSAGQNAEQVRQEDPNGQLTPKQSAILAASGAITGLLGYGAGKVANKLGIGDIDTMLAQGKLGATGADAIQTGANKGLLRKAGEGFMTEGALQELPQSYQEQVAQNLAQGKPWDEGAAEAGAQGMMTGGLMGAGGAPLHSGDHTTGAVSAPAHGENADPSSKTPQPSASVDPSIDQANLAARVRSDQLDQQERGEPIVPQTTPPDGAAVLNAQQAERERIRLAEQEASRAVSTPDDEIYQSVGIDNRTPSRRMGLDPNAGAMSAAAALAVDTGASAHMAQQDVTARKDQASTEASLKVDPDTGEVTQDLSSWSDQKLRDFFQGASSSSIRRQLATELSRRRTEREQQQVLQAALDSQQNAPEPTTTINNTVKQTEGSQKNGTQADQAEQGSTQSAQTGAAAPGMERGATAAGGTQDAAAIRKGASGVAGSNGASVHAAQVESPEVSALREQLRSVEGKILHADPDYMAQGGGDIESAMKSRKVPVTLKVQRQKLKGKLEQAKAQEMRLFPAESGTLGVPRSEMPQVPAQSHGGLVQHLNAKGISHETTMVDAGSLKPTQAEYSPAKVQKAKSATSDRSVIVSRDGHIIDGHHQAVAAAEEGKPVKAIVLDAPVEKALQAVKDSPSALPETGKQEKPAHAAPGKPRGVLAKKAAYDAKARADFTPGNVVKSASGGHDRVIAYTPPGEDGQWSVKVRAVHKQGDSWVEESNGRDRHHSIQPDAKALKAGPVGKAAQIDQQVKEHGEADGAQRIEDSDRSLMRRILKWKKGGEAVHIGEATLTGVNLGRDGYPASIKLAPTDGSTSTNDTVDLAALFRPKGMSVPHSKRRVRELVDAVRAEDAEQAPQAETAPAASASKTPHLDAHADLMARVRRGEATANEYKAAFERTEASQEAITAELNTMKKDDLLKSGGYNFHQRYRDEKKGDIIHALVKRIIDEYALDRRYGSSSFVMSAAGMEAHRKAQDAALRDLVANTTDADIQAHAKEVAQAHAEVDARREATQKALSDPQTLSDFRSVLSRSIEQQGDTLQQAYLRLTPEQRQRFDDLAAESTKAQREQAKAKQRSQVASAGNTTAGEVIAAKHTKHGHDLYVVQLVERVSKEDYDTLNSSAKRMGGSYSSYRGNGAVPGFQFRTREAADAFRKLVAGDTTDAQAVAGARRDAFEDDRSQSAAERLHTMADALNGRADEELNRDRKTNTVRRARMADSAEASARADKALAGTMNNLARAIESGKTKFLDSVRQKVQVEFLARELHNAKDAQIRAKYPTYGEQERHRGEPIDAETVDYASFPSYTAMRSDLASIARQMLEVDGTKRLGARLMSVADDVTGAYTDWAKQNLLSVSRFGRAGEMAEFANRDQAERAIRRSGIADKAIVLPIRRGVNRIVLSPGEAMRQGLWQGDGDKHITLNGEFGRELVDAIGRRSGGRKIALPWTLEAAYEKRKRLEGMGIFTPSEYRAALREFAGFQEAMATPDKIKQMERALIGRRSDGLDFFPTSEAVAESMLDAADIKEGMDVLEPSAGMGHIADAIREKTGAEPDVAELSGDRRELLEAKGYNLAGDDFMAMEPRKFFTFGDVFRAPDGTEGIMHGGRAWSGRVSLHAINEDGSEGRMLGWYDRDELTGIRQRGSWSGYDRIVMNPPFSKGRDIEHVQHAYELLRPGGRLVALMGEGAFFHKNQASERFREWLDSLGATSEKLPEGSFMDPALPVNTAANARMVVIDKPAGNTVPFSRLKDGDNTESPGAADGQRTTESGVPAGLAAERTRESDRLEGVIDGFLARSGEPTGFKALAIRPDQLPDALRGALDGFERVTGTRVVVFRNLTPEVADFNGVTVRDGVLYVNETSQHPVTATAAHEWVHDLRKTHPDLYQLLEDEVRSQGDAPGFAAKHGYDLQVAHEELTASAVGDALSDPDFLQRLAQHDQGGFRRVARGFLDFLQTLMAGWKDQGSNAYLRDVQAFRNRLEEMLSRYGRGDGLNGDHSAFDEAHFGERQTHVPQEGVRARGDGAVTSAAEAKPVRTGSDAYMAAGRSDAEKARVLQGMPVAVLRGDEAPQTGMAAVRKWASDLFASQGNRATNPDIGEVVMDDRSVRDSLAHGKPNPFKYSAFAAVKDVLERGVLVHAADLGRDGWSFYVSAPVKIRGMDDVVTVLVRQDVNTQRMYLHSVATKESLLNRRVSGADATKGKEQSGSSSSGGRINVANTEVSGKATSSDVAHELSRLLALDVSSENAGAAFSGQRARTGTTTDRAIMAMARDGKPASDILSLVAETSRNRFNRQVARLLMKAGVAPKVELLRSGELGYDKGGFALLAKYSRVNDAVSMTIGDRTQAQAEQIFLHEMIHAATLKALDRSGLQSLQMRRLYDHVKQQGGAAGQYGMKNVGEFVAEAFTNPEFQQALRSMSAPKGSVLKSAWHQFVRILRSILGLPQGSSSALSQALELGVNVMREDAALRRNGRDAGAESDAFAQSAATRSTFEARIDALFKGGKAITGTRVLDRSDVMGLLGYPDVPLMLNERHLLDGLTNHPEMTAEAWKKVPGWLENPAAVYTDPSHPGRLTVIAPDRIAGYPVVMAIEPNAGNPVGGKAGQAQLLVTVFAKTSGDLPALGYLASSGRLKYADSRIVREAWTVGVNPRAEPTTSALQRAQGPRAFPMAGRGVSDNTSAIPRGRFKILTEKNLSGWKKAHAGDVHFGAEQQDEAHFGAVDMDRMKASALTQIQAAMGGHPGTVSLWDKTVGTMLNLAEKAPAFKPVFESAERFLDDISDLANDAADRAPRLLPRVESWRDLSKRPISAIDSKAVSKPLFEGTLLWARDVDGTPVKVDELEQKYASSTADEKSRMLLRAGKIDPDVLRMWQGMPTDQFEKSVDARFKSQMLTAGVVWSDEELERVFHATPEQISLYHEARAAIDRSIDMTARADMLRSAGEGYAHLRDMVMEAPTLEDAGRVLVETLEEEARTYPDNRERIADVMDAIRSRMLSAQKLQDQGYAPLSRFGRYTVDVVDANGERQYFGMYESKRESNLALLKMKQVFPGAKVEQGTLSQEAFKLFSGVTPESLELFGNMLGLKSEGHEAIDQVFQQYLALTKNNHSALKRLIHRKGIAGYSDDVGRVLASFVYANARQASSGLNAGVMDRAINDIPKAQGELRDVAMRMRNYLRDPQEEGQAVRGMLFAQYLGGSVASAMVNMTQPFTVTLPWLSRFGGMRNAGAQLARAVKDMASGARYEPDLAAALKAAEEDGTVSPQEIHQLMAQARGAGALQVGDGTRAGNARAAVSNAWERTKVAWGQPFALAEQFNRRSTFIAAYRTAQERGMADPAGFAREAVKETQFVYSKANRPQWARGTIGGTLFTFKTYSVSYLELLHRMWTQGGPEGKRAVAWALVMLMLMSGAGGLPFMEDLEDLVDGVGQMMGYDVSLKHWRQQALRSVVGKEMGEFLENGVSGLPGAPVDVSGRMGMGNLIPGTGFLLSKKDHTRDAMEVLGPAGDLVTRGFTGGRKFLTGDVAGAAMDVAPTAVRNAVKGADMATSGMYRDSKGYKVLDTSLAEAAGKFIGFQPRSVAQVQEANAFMQRSKSFYIDTSNEIKAQWAKALFEHDDAALAAVRKRLADWNENNPDERIVIKVGDVWKRVREMGKDRTKRIAETSPKSLRQEMRSMAREAQ